MTRPLSLLTVALLTAGCGGASPQQSPRASRDAAAPPAPAAAPAPQFDIAARPDGAKDAAPGAKPPAGNVPASQRLVVHTAAMEVVVKDLAATTAAVETAVDTAGGYVAKADLAGTAGGRRSATWTLKVPVAQYRGMLSKLAALGSLVRQTADSQDVTEEFADLSARVKSLKVEEETLQKLLKDAVGRLDDIIKVREQIKTVRLDIDRAEGRALFLSNRAELSTVTLSACEGEVYTPAPVTPPTPPAAFGDTLGGTFQASVGALTDIGKALLVAVVAAAPWLPFALAGLLAAHWTFRRATRPVAVR